MSRLRDSRVNPSISTASVWRSVFGMFVTRRRSLNELEQELRRPSRWDRFVGGKKPSADTIGYSLDRFALDPLRAMVLDVNRQAWRSKSVHSQHGDSRRVIALDGHELSSSRSRCCDQCLLRTLRVNGEDVTQYYHRVVVAQWVGVCPPGILDVELQRPGEGEVIAARRLLARLLQTYSRLFDVITVDALYLEAPFFQQVLAAGKHVVAVMKQEARDLYQDADGLRQSLAPVLSEGPGWTTRLWDLDRLNTFSTLGRPVRVVWTEERKARTRYVGGQAQLELVDSEWVWVTDLPSSEASASCIQRWGHERWDIENRGFNELVQLWGMNHVFRHHPTAIEALLLTLAVAFLTTYLFYERDLKPQLRRRLTRLALAARLLEGLGELASRAVSRETRPPPPG